MTCGLNFKILVFGSGNPDLLRYLQFEIASINFKCAKGQWIRNFAGIPVACGKM